MNRKQWFVLAGIFFLTSLIYLKDYNYYFNFCMSQGGNMAHIFCFKANIFIAFEIMFGAFSLACLLCGLLELKGKK